MEKAGILLARYRILWQNFGGMSYTPRTPVFVSGQTPLGIQTGPVQDLVSRLDQAFATAVNQNPDQFGVKGVTLEGLATQYGEWLQSEVAAYPFIQDGSSVGDLMAQYFTGPNAILPAVLAKVPTDPSGKYQAGFLSDGDVFGKLNTLSGSSGLATLLDLSGFPLVAAKPVPIVDPNNADANPNPPSSGIWHKQLLLTGLVWVEGASQFPGYATYVNVNGTTTKLGDGV